MAAIKQGQAGPFEIGDDMIAKAGLRGVPIKLGIESNIDAQFAITLSTGEAFILKVGRTGMYESDDFVEVNSCVYKDAGSFQIKKPMLDYTIGES